MLIDESIKNNSVETIKMRLSVLSKAKKDLPHLGESELSELSSLKDLYSGIIEKDGRQFLPEKQFYILDRFIKKDRQAITRFIVDSTIKALSPEDLSEEYCNFVAEETKKAIRARIDELSKEIELKENTSSNRQIAVTSSRGSLDPESFKKRSAPESRSDRISSRKKAAVTFSGIDEGNVAERKDSDSRPRGGSLGGSSK